MSKVSIPSVYPIRMYPDWGCSETVYSQFYSTYHGAMNTKTKYIIKTRSDEFYEDLTPFINEFLKNDNRIVCGTAFVRPWYECTHQFGDHMFIVKTEVLRNALKKLLEMYTIAPKDQSIRKEMQVEYNKKKGRIKEIQELTNAKADAGEQPSLQMVEEANQLAREIHRCPCITCQPDNPWGSDTISPLEDWAGATYFKNEQRWHLCVETVWCKAMLIQLGVSVADLNRRELVNEYVKIVNTNEAKHLIVNTNSMGYSCLDNFPIQHDIAKQEHMFPVWYSNDGAMETSND
jgi:hypothetical protein